MKQETYNMIHASGYKFHDQGFTLIEAVVAVSIFAVTVTSMVGVYLSVQRLNQQNTALQFVQQNGRFITEDLTKLIRNGRIDYSRYSGGTVPQPATTNLYIIDRDGVSVRIYQSGDQLIIDKTGIGSSAITSSEAKVLNFQVYIWPSTDPFSGGAVREQPTATIYLDLESNINSRDKVRIPFQISVATKIYSQ